MSAFKWKLLLLFSLIGTHFIYLPSSILALTPTVSPPPSLTSPTKSLLAHYGQPFNTLDRIVDNYLNSLDFTHLIHFPPVDCPTQLLAPHDQVFIVTGDTITFTWSSCPQATKYQFQTGPPGSQAWNFATTTTAATFSITINGSSWWQVRACIDAACTLAGEWSEKRSLVLLPPTPCSTDTQCPDGSSCKIDSPPNQGTCAPNRGTWQCAGGGAGTVFCPATSGINGNNYYTIYQSPCSNLGQSSGFCFFNDCRQGNPPCNPNNSGGPHVMFTCTCQ